MLLVQLFLTFLQALDFEGCQVLSQGWGARVHSWLQPLLQAAVCALGLEVARVKQLPAERLLRQVLLD